MKSVLILLFFLVSISLVAGIYLPQCSAACISSQCSIDYGIAPLLHADGAKVINGSYIVILKEHLDKTDRDGHIMELQELIWSTHADAKIGFRFHIGNLLGFSARLPDDLLKAVLAHPDVSYVECDQIVSINLAEEKNALAPRALVTQTGATWGLVRISQRDLALTPSNYIYESGGGTGVDAFIIDSGVLTTHVDFGGRASFVFSAVPNEQSTDLNGHGTHCAGTVGGTVYGVAKNVSIRAVKVLNASGSGTIAGVVAGIDYITNNRDPNRPAVASMSLGGGISSTLDTAVTNSIASGIAYAVAAGGDNYDACNYSPARVPTAITAAATTNTDARASYSNIGTCVDIFAPGSSITSDWIGSNTATNTISGTSFSTTHVAGALAVFLSQNPTFTPSQVKSYLISNATPNKVTNAGTGSPNLLLYTL